MSQPNVVAEAAHFPVLTWTDQQVIVSWHQTVRETFFVESLQSLIKDLLKRFVVRIFLKNGRTKVRPVEHVLAIPRRISTFGSSQVRHSSKEDKVSKLQLKRKWQVGQPKRYRTRMALSTAIHGVFDRAAIAA
jgi:hypothetical protein